MIKNVRQNITNDDDEEETETETEDEDEDDETLTSQEKIERRATRTFWNISYLRLKT